MDWRTIFQIHFLETGAGQVPFNSITTMDMKNVHNDGIVTVAARAPICYGEGIIKVFINIMKWRRIFLSSHYNKQCIHSPIFSTHNGIFADFFMIKPPNTPMNVIQPSSRTEHDIYIKSNGSQWLHASILQKYRNDKPNVTDKTHVEGLFFCHDAFTAMDIK